MERSKILIVDDEPLNITLYDQMLKKSARAVLKAYDGPSALKIVREERPDLVILDWNMPLMSGIEVLREMKSDPDTKDIDVIMITGVMTASESLRVAMETGATDFLRKPFDKTELLARIRSILLMSRYLRELREKYRIIENYNKFINSLIESVPHPLVWYSPEGIIEGCNQLFEELAGLPAVELAGKLVYRYLDWEEASLHIKFDMELLSAGKPCSFEGGSQDNKLYIYSKSVYQNAAGAVQGILCILIDITEMKRMHNDLVEAKKKELVSSALRLIKVNESNNQLIEELGKLTSYTNKQGTELIRNIIHHFNIQPGENIWKDFETRFEKVYEGFYKKLNQQFPNLTPGERKLCALLRLNVTSKDIAAITFQNPQSVDMARYRLRKKLNLSTDENLVDFLMKFDA
jgi:PAS domain S-box-containing protein